MFPLHVDGIWCHECDTMLLCAVILPHLAVLAIRNNQNVSDALRAEVAELLLEAYTALSCTCILWQDIIAWSKDGCCIRFILEAEI